MSLLTCTLVTPERLVFSSEVEMVVVPGQEGDFGILANHAPFISMIRPGVVELHNGSAPVEKLFISAGYAETHGTECTILAETAEPLDYITREKIEADMLIARKDLEHASDEFSKARAEKSLLVLEAKQRAIA